MLCPTDHHLTATVTEAKDLAHQTSRPPWPFGTQLSCSLELSCRRGMPHMHQIRKQPNAALPSGSTPTQFFSAPNVYGGEYAFVPIPQEAIDELRQLILVTCDEAFEWVDDDFAAMAESLWDKLGRPERSLISCWDVFTQRIGPLGVLYEESHVEF